ncbi:hypothetical protein BN7_6421 [Wickerhamomyces ciferrii]|uniref:Uncharacterized protein n=1 Tax=Wickerhamomyces ciferrii (strain ATCC 14091 / BCRC 22168 / CBS 111 / JCM 3599 / NBRC 0793 / NRRL Y-1031 F-60-10) TaxID=1206466 RepID=K0KXQ7_WICCF|nr:uncharacterized protein BN7_6421 [Wickerhamomyces ciferrii]CCH46822.1 hypothetical protein BN7_6421 [Wickerhamomyces ciferrii]
MSFNKGHKRRPTSIATDQILKDLPATPTRSVKEYKAADGSVLQSSMVKSGSPTKRQMRGTPSQVRFSLPPQDSINDDDEDDDDDTSGMNLNDSIISGDFDHRSIFNSESKQLQAPFRPDKPRGRSTSRRPLSVADSMREMLNTSPDRKKLFIRGETEFNKQLVPIPLELSLPPILSPNNKDKRRPTSLVYNGTDYEPFEIDYYTPQAKKVSNILPPTDSEPRSKSYSPVKITKKPEPIKQSIPIKQPAPQRAEKPLPQVLSKQIEIPNLDKPYSRPVSKLFKENQLDNEEFIQHPSKAAKAQNNELNRTFSFPPRPRNELQKQQTKEQSQQPDIHPQIRISHQQSNSTKVFNKEVDQITRAAHQDSHQDRGLGIFSRSGPVHELPHQNHSELGRFAQVPHQQPQYHQPNQPQYSSQQSELQQQYAQTGYTQPQPSPHRRHVHRRSKSIIDFPVDEFSEIPTAHVGEQQKPKELQQINTNIQNLRNISDEQNMETPGSNYSSIPSAIPSEKENYEDEDDQASFDSIQESLDLAHSDIESLEVQSIKTAESALSEEPEADPEQLLDLGRLILSSRSDVDLSKKQPRQLKNNSPPLTSRLRNEVTENRAETVPSRSIVRELPPQPSQLQQQKPLTTSASTLNVQKLRGQPLGSQLEPQVVRLIDNSEPDRIRQISHHKVHERTPKKVQNSPNPSQSSYESEISEPFSATSSNQTAETTESIHKGSTTTIDLTNEGYDIITKKDNRPNRNNRVPSNDSYRSTFENINGKVRETVILDEDEDDELVSVTEPLHIRHKRSKSALGNLEFDKANRSISNFSFESVGSEVQLHYDSSEKAKELSLNRNRRPLRTYTEQNRTVFELCDDTMKSTKQVLDHLQRQKTILLNKQRELLKSKNRDEGRLTSIRKLQEDLKKVQLQKQKAEESQKQERPQKPKMTRPQSYVYGESPIVALQDRQASNPTDYYDYRNNQSYNFETYIRNQSNSSMLV